MSRHASLADVAANDNLREKTVLGEGNVKWGGERHKELVALMRIDDVTPLKNLATLVSACYKLPCVKSTSSAYVIGDADGGVVKIGMARNPINRLASLQTGNHKRLYLHRVFQVRRPGIAQRMEMWAHTIAGDTHRRLEGEWFECGPSEAHDVIDKAADEILSGYIAMTPSYVNEVAYVRAA